MAPFSMWVLLWSAILLGDVKCEVSPHIITFRPSMDFTPQETVDAIEDSGVFIRNLGRCLVERGAYRIITPIDFEVLEESLARVRRDSQDFFMNYTSTVHSRKWDKILNGEEIKKEIYDMIIHAVDETRSEIERVEQMFRTLSYAFRPATTLGGRKHRGWFDGIGDLLSMAFGLATSDQLKAADSAAKSTQSDLVKVLHLNKQLVSLVQTQHSQVETIFKHQETLRNATLNLLMKIQYQAIRSDEARRQGLRNYLRQRLNQYHATSLVTINAIGDQLGLYFAELGSVMSGRVNPTLIHPLVLKELIKSIAKELPDHLTLPVAASEEDLYQYYRILRPELLRVSENRKLLVLEVPILRKFESYDLLLPTVLRLPMFNHLNATSSLKIRNNQIYAAHKTENEGYVLNLGAVNKCTEWGKIYICDPTSMQRAIGTELSCLRGVQNSNKQVLKNCTKIVRLNDQHSQLEHLRGGDWAYSIRGNLSLGKNCHDGRGEEILSVFGMGRVQLPEGCTFRSENEEVTAPITLRIRLNHTVAEVNNPVRIPRGFLAASLPWEGVGVSDVQPADLGVLKGLQTALANEAAFHLEGTALKQKAQELLNLTDALITKGEVEASRGPWFTVPSNNDYLYLGSIGLVIILITIHLHLVSRNPNMGEKQVDQLQRLLDCRFNPK